MVDTAHVPVAAEMQRVGKDVERVSVPEIHGSYLSFNNCAARFSQTRGTNSRHVYRTWALNIRTRLQNRSNAPVGFRSDHHLLRVFQPGHFHG